MSKRGITTTIAAVVAIVTLIVGIVIGIAVSPALFPPPPPVGVVPKADYDAAIAERDKARSDYNALKSDYDSLKADYEKLKAAGLPDEIKIGCVYPLSGALAPICVKIVKAAELAAKIVNDGGGIAGRPVKLIVEDDAAEPEKAIAAVKKLVEVDGVQVIVGAASSPEMLAVAEYLNRRHVPIISPSATAIKIGTEYGDDYLFRTVVSDALQTAALADLVKDREWKRIATFVLGQDYGIGLEQGLKTYLGEVAPEVEVAVSIRYDPAKMEYKSELQQVKDANPDAIFFATWVEDGWVVFKQAMDLGLEGIPTFGGEGMCDVAFFEDPTAAEYMTTTHMMGTKPYSPTETYSYLQFSEAYKEAYGEEPGLFTDYMFDATMIAILSVAKAGAYDGEAIKGAIPVVAEHYIGASGQKTMDKNGDQLLGLYDIWEIVMTPGGAEYHFIGKWEKTTGIAWTE